LKIKRTKARKARRLEKRVPELTHSNDEQDGRQKTCFCGITGIDAHKADGNQQRNAQSELDDPEFRQEFVQKLKTLFDGNFEEESTQQLQDILDNIRSNQTIALDAPDKYTQVFLFCLQL
jgi:hypothetical protein